MTPLTVRRTESLTPTLIDDLLDVDPFFETDLLDLELPMYPSASLFERVPSVNYLETDKEFMIEVAAPGLTKKDFKVEVENNMLNVSAEKEEKYEREFAGEYRREFSYNSFNRSFILPENRKEDKIEAEYENGILKIVIPKKEITKAGPKKEISVS